MHDDTTDIDDRPFLRTVRVDLRGDGCRYVQPGRPLDTLRAIAALVRSIPAGSYPSVMLGCSAAAVDFLAAQGGRTGEVPHTRGTGELIAFAWLELDGVRFEAQVTKPPPAGEKVT